MHSWVSYVSLVFCYTFVTVIGLNGFIWLYYEDSASSCDQDSEHDDQEVQQDTVSVFDFDTGLN